MKGLARLVDELMQPSRAIDDAPEDLGRKKILFQACYAAAEVDSRDADANGDRFTVGVESVTSTIAKDLIENGVQSSVDVYGAPDGIQLHKTSRGVRYSAQPASMGEDRQPLRAVRMRVEQGSLVKQEVDEVVMHKD